MMVFEEIISGKVQNSEGYKSLSSVVINNICLLYMDQEVKKTFTPQPMVSYRSAVIFLGLYWI